VFDWMNRKSEPWSLATLKLPWDTPQSLCEIIINNPRTPLPEEDSGTRIRWAAGALDGVMGHHAGRGDGMEDVSRVLVSLRALLAKSSDANLQKVYDAVCKAPLLGYVDQLLPAIESEFSSDRARLAALARLFIVNAPRREAVKFGIAILGIAGNESDLEVLRKIGVCDEFTLFAAVAIQNVSPAYERDLWELAKAVEGWGRIHLIERLAHTEDHEIRAWLLREGYRNAVMDEYVACICARAGKLDEALRSSPKDEGLLDSATDLILAMITGGPAEDIDDYAHAAEAVEAYLDAVWVQSTFSPKKFVVVDRVREWLISSEGWEKRSKCGWSVTNRERCLLLSQELLSREEWRSEALRNLASPDASVFHWANRAARKLGVDTWDVLYAKVESDPVSSTFWYDLTEATDGLRIDRLVSFAEHVIPLDEIASGPADEIGLGPGFEPHSTLDWMLQLLDRFPGKGWGLIRAGLQSPVVRNRNWSLRVFKNWQRDDWPEEAPQVLRAAANAEPDDKLKKNLEACLEDAKESAP
jgi:hypothetical protein